VAPANGEVLADADRYRRIQLPGSVGAIDFGVPLAVATQSGPGSVVRCGLLSSDDAVRLAASLFEFSSTDAIAVTPDATKVISIAAQPIFVPTYGCDNMAADLAPAPVPGVTLPPVTGLLAGLDPCAFVSAEAMAIADGDALGRRQALQPFGVPANACVLSDTTTGAERAIITLYPERAVGGAVDDAISAAFGIAWTKADVDGQSLWARTCEAADSQCTLAYAIANREQLVVVQFGQPARSLPGQRAFLSAVMAHLR
jgi:hypothetical protein